MKDKNFDKDSNIEMEVESKKLGPNETITLEEGESLADQIKIISPGRLVLKRFLRSKLSIVGLAMLIFLFLFSFVGPMISPYGEIERVGATKVLKTIYEYKEIDPITKEEFVYYEVNEQVVSNLTPPTSKNWLGTDTLGYDILTRLMYGGRVSLLLSFIVIFAEMFLGIVIGGIAGYFGKWVDQIIMRIVDIFNCLPTLPILLISSALLDGWNVAGSMRIYALMGILTIFGWSGIARMVRGQILSLREQEYMVAAEAVGLSSTRKIFKHLIPNVMPQLIVSATLGLGSIILYESTLSFLNLGVPFPYAAWGTMIGQASPQAGGGRDILLNYPNLWVPAGVMIVTAVLGFNFVGDGLRDAFDPKMKR